MNAEQKPAIKEINKYLSAQEEALKICEKYYLKSKAIRYGEYPPYVNNLAKKVERTALEGVKTHKNYINNLQEMISEVKSNSDSLIELTSSQFEEIEYIVENTFKIRDNILEKVKPVHLQLKNIETFRNYIESQTISIN